MRLTLSVPEELRLGGRTLVAATSLRAGPAGRGIEVFDRVGSTETQLGELTGDPSDPDVVARALLDASGVSATNPLLDFERGALAGIRTWLGCLNVIAHERRGSVGRSPLAD